MSLHLIHVFSLPISCRVSSLTVALLSNHNKTLQTVNLTLCIMLWANGDKFQHWKHLFDNAICKMAAILSLPQWFYLTTNKVITLCQPRCWSTPDYWQACVYLTPEDPATFIMFILIRPVCSQHLRIIHFGYSTWLHLILINILCTFPCSYTFFFNLRKIMFRLIYGWVLSNYIPYFYVDVIFVAILQIKC